MNKEIFEENDRNIRVFGLETMKKLFETEVLILGFTPAMTELSKNLILSGAGICLFDSGIKIEKKDTENNFVFNINDTGKSKAIVLKEKIKLFKDPCKITIISDINEIKSKNIKFGVVDLGDGDISIKNNLIKDVEKIMISNRGILYYIKLQQDKGIFLNNILEKKFYEKKENEGKEPLFQKDEKITEHLTLSDDEEEGNTNPNPKEEKKEEKKEMDIVDISNDEEKKIEILKEDDYYFFDFEKKIEEIKNLIPKKLKKYEEDIINSAFNVIKISNNKNANPLFCLMNYIIGGIVCHEIINCISRKKNIRTNVYYFDGFSGNGKFLNELYDKTYD